MFSNESTLAQASSSRGASRVGSSGSTEALIGATAPNGMIKAFSVGTASSSNVTPQPTSYKSKSSRRQSSNPFVGRSSSKKSKKSKSKKAVKSKKKRKVERGHARDCDGLQCQTLSQSNSQSNAHHRHHSSEIYKASKKRGCSCHKHRKESRKSKKKEKKSKKDKKTKQQ